MTASPTQVSPTQTTTSFFKDELERALSEQAFGITSYELTSSSAFDATARVELLEKTKLEINLSIRGYQTTNTPSRAGSSSEPAEATVFESLESLLLHASPVYAVKRTELLLSKLAS